MDSNKKLIFVNAVKARMASESITKETAIAKYTKLTEEEKADILQNV